MARKLLLGDISDLNVRRFEHIYNDPRPHVGLALKGKEGNVTVWALTKELRDERENELIGWELTPIRETIEAQPSLAGWTLRLLND